MAHYNDGEVNFGPLIDLNSEDLAPTEKDATTMAKSPVPVGSSTPHTERHSNDETVDQVLKAITAISIGIEKQNSALEDRFGDLSKRLDALETKQRDNRVTLGTSPRDSGLDLFSNHEEVRFSELPAPLSPSPCHQLPQQKEKPRVRPSPYNGSTPWEDYKAQFELVAEIDGWDGRTKAAYLAVSLSGPAQAVLGDLDKTQRTSYADLVAALNSRFGTSNRTEMFRVSLRSRTRKPKETLPELAQAIRRLTRQAYPDAPISLRESIAKDQFIEALTDPELRWKVHQAKAATLTEALDAAVEVEAFFSAEKQRGGTKILQAVTTQSPTPADSTLKQELHELKTLVQGLVQQPRGISDLSQRSWQRTWTSPECWACGAQGHIQRYCPKRLGDGLRTPSGRLASQQPQECPGNETLSSSRARARQTNQR